MKPNNDVHYDDDKLNGLAIAELILDEWNSGKHESIAAVTTAVHGQALQLPRSVIFWLAYHTLRQYTQLFEGQQNTQAQSWPPR